MNGLVDLLSDQIKVVANFDAIVDEDFEYVNDSIKKLFIVRSDVSKLYDWEYMEKFSPFNKKWPNR